MAAVNISGLDADPERLHLHAAAAVKDGRVVVVAAERDTGKSTTIAHLVKRGWAFVTDETVSLAPDRDRGDGLRQAAVDQAGRPWPRGPPHARG